MEKESIWKSRRFWVLVLDTVIALVLFFVGKYSSSAMFEDVKFLIVTLQPVFLTLIGSYTYQSVQETKAFSAKL